MEKAEGNNHNNKRKAIDDYYDYEDDDADEEEKVNMFFALIRNINEARNPRKRSSKSYSDEAITDSSKAEGSSSSEKEEKKKKKTMSTSSSCRKNNAASFQWEDFVEDTSIIRVRDISKRLPAEMKSGIISSEIRVPKAKEVNAAAAASLSDIKVRGIEEKKSKSTKRVEIDLNNLPF